jgi:hypothetical protein
MTTTSRLLGSLGVLLPTMRAAAELRLDMAAADRKMLDDRDVADESGSKFWVWRALTHKASSLFVQEMLACGDEVVVSLLLEALELLFDRLVRSKHGHHTLVCAVRLRPASTFVAEGLYSRPAGFVGEARHIYGIRVVNAVVRYQSGLACVQDGLSQLASGAYERFALETLVEVRHPASYEAAKVLVEASPAADWSSPWHQLFASRCASADAERGEDFFFRPFLAAGDDVRASLATGRMDLAQPALQALEAGSAVRFGVRGVDEQTSGPCRWAEEEESRESEEEWPAHFAGPGVGDAASTQCETPEESEGDDRQGSFHDEHCQPGDGGDGGSSQCRSSDVSFDGFTPGYVLVAHHVWVAYPVVFCAPIM